MFNAGSVFRHMYLTLLCIQECKQLGFDTVELNVGSLEVPEESLLRFVRLIKSGGLKAKPQFAVKFNKSDVPVSGDRAFGAYVVPTPRSSGNVAIFYQNVSCIYLGAFFFPFICILLSPESRKNYGFYSCQKSNLWFP